MSIIFRPPVRDWPFLIDGKWISAGETFEVRAPFDQSVVGRAWRGTHEHAEAATAAAARAFQTTRNLASYEKQKILHDISDAIRVRREEFATLIALEAGKPIKTARAEVDRAIFTFAVAAEESMRTHGEWLSLDWQASTKDRAGIVRRFPIGPILAITPFNFPLNLVAHKVAPAIAAGCSVVLKPAPQTPLTSMLLAEVIEKAGVVPGAFNVVPLANAAAEKLVSDDRFKLLSFTGSVPVGWKLKEKSGKKKVTLELGGNAAVIVHSDANVEEAADRCVAGGFSYAGQSCISVQRIFVQASVSEKFLKRLLEGVAKLKTGNPLDEASDVGPLISEDAAQRAEAWIKEAVAAGAKVEAGGRRHGAMLEPTVLTQTKANMKVSCQEVFAPVVLVEPYEEFDDALKMTNDSAFGLQAAVFTSNVKLLFKAFEELEVGGVIADDVSSFRIDHMPYGGVKDSGIGREGLRYAIEDMTEPRILVMRLP